MFNDNMVSRRLRADVLLYAYDMYFIFKNKTAIVYGRNLSLHVSF